MTESLGPGSRVGFVGLGNMGHPMAARLAAAGYALHLVDAWPDVARHVAAEIGARALASIAELGTEMDAVVLMLPDGQAVRRVVLDDGLIGRLTPGSVVIDMGSCDPSGTVQLGETLGAAAIGLADAPVSGGVARARTGELTIMVGGAPTTVERCRPLLAAMGSRIFATGALGSGQAMKSLNNFVSAVGLVATVEAVLIGERFGVDPDVAAEVLNGSTAKNNTTEHKLRQFILSRSFASGFSLDLMVKDLAIAASVARRSQVSPVLSEWCLDFWRAAQEALGRGHDHTEVARWVESTMGVERERPGVAAPGHD